MNDFLLSDENNISQQDYNERLELIEIFKSMPIDFFSKLRHLQPQIGCLNACKICSKFASTNVSSWSVERIRNIIAALKYATPATQLPLIVWDRDNHRSGVVFSYLDNDVGFYENLDEFINIVYKELGVKNRISTVGYSRHNDKLNQMHEKISKNYEALAGVRLSFTPYEIGWTDKHNSFNRDEYQKDIANFLKVYKSYYDIIGSGSRNFCVELRYKPLVVNDDVYIFEHNHHTIISTKYYLYISKEPDIKFQKTYIVNPKVHRLSLTDTGVKFYKISLNKKLKNMDEIILYLKEWSKNIEKEVNIYYVENKDGPYYSIDPQLTDDGNFGINIYPKTVTRKQSGYIVLERFFLNSLFEYKKENNLTIDSEYNWSDVSNVIKKLLEKQKQFLLLNNVENASYIENDMLPMIISYARALYEAGYSANCFFDKNFTIDTGTICNLGRAITEFKGLVSFQNEPLTLNHERNYGRFNSTMTVEDISWRLSCGYNDTIIVEKLDMKSTASQEGQACYCKEYKLHSEDDKMEFSIIKRKCLIPGQRRIENGD